MIKNRFTARFFNRVPGRWTPLEPILHASPRRLRFLGLSMFFGNPLFYWVWSGWFKQPYENAWLRLLMSMMGMVLLIKPVSQHLLEPRVRLVVFLTMWAELPLFFSWMYLCNAGGKVWLPSLCVIVLVYYNLTDWRLAAAGNRQRRPGSVGPV